MYLKTTNIKCTVLQILTLTSFKKCFICFRNDADPDNNLRVGIVLVVSFFLVISVLAFPNGTGMSTVFYIVRAVFMNFDLIVFIMSFNHSVV